ncbi:PEP-CTERM sorting domain-containing protein [Methylotuvimicrobium sp. KM2]|uniref:PEP-CTERM sorting domain-containing protein n=1 Tax=Methylotuvimicrobium sp. KM2 TaxID=3133976 RepID=UPI003100FBDC
MKRPKVVLNMAFIFLTFAGLYTNDANSALVGAEVGAYLDISGHSGFPFSSTEIGDLVEFSFLETDDIKAGSANFFDNGLILDYTNLSSTGSVDFTSRQWTFLFNSWPAIQQIIESITPNVGNPSGASVGLVSTDIFAIDLPALKVDPEQRIEWRFEIATRAIDVPEPTVLSLLGLGTIVMGFRRYKPR